jgi:hypothetical protein
MVYNYNVALNSGGRSVGTSTVPGGAGNAFGYQAKIGVSYLASQGTDHQACQTSMHEKRLWGECETEPLKREAVPHRVL